MALKSISTERMIGVTGAWVDPEQDRPVIEKNPVLAVLLPSLDEVHAGVLALRRPATDTKQEKELAALAVEGGEVDGVHDGQLRGGWHYLTAVAMFCRDGGARQQLLDLRDRVFPSGLAATQLSWGEESGNARAVEEHLDDATWAVLRRYKTLPGRTLADEITDWLGAARELGVLDNRRARVLAEQQQAETTLGLGRGENLQPRNRWIRVVRAFANLVSLLGDAALDARLLGPLRDAEARAERRQSRRAADPELPDPPTGSTGADADK